MYASTLLITALCAAGVFASPTPEVEKRYTKTRLTQYPDHTCSLKSIFEAKGWSVGDKGCVDIDGQTNSINMAFGTGPEGHKGIRAYSQTGCPSNADIGEIPSIGGTTPDKGGCLDVNSYLVNEPTFYGYRINSIRFV